MSVNLSARHLQQPDFVAELQTSLSAYPGRAPSEGPELEILETVALDGIVADFPSDRKL